MSQYLGRGAKSRGRFTIPRSLNPVGSEGPYLKHENDVAAFIPGLARLQEALSGYEGLVWLAPSANQTAREFVEDVSATATSLSIPSSKS